MSGHFLDPSAQRGDATRATDGSRGPSAVLLLDASMYRAGRPCCNSESLHFQDEVRFTRSIEFK